MSVDLLCQLADVRIDRVQYDLTPGLWQTRSSAKLRLLNPTRRVPVLVRNSDANANANPSFVLTESTAILRYLADDVVAPDSPWRRAADATVRAKIDGNQRNQKKKKIVFFFLSQFFLFLQSCWIGGRHRCGRRFVNRSICFLFMTVKIATK
jgi:hypothetical protein